jgi:hypothetical protein
MAKDSDKLRRRVDVEQASSALTGLLAEEDEFDRRALWRLGTWAAVSIGAVIVALITNQSSIGLRHEQTASADLLKQAQQLQSTAKESENATRRLASAIDTLNSDRDRLFSRVAVLEQGLDSVTGAIARQSAAPAPSQTTASQTGPSQANAKTIPPVAAVAAPASPPPSTVASTASTAASPTPLADPAPVAAKPSPAPVASTAPAVGPVAATTPVVMEKAATPSASVEKATTAATAPAPVEKQDKQASKPPASADKPPASTEPGPTVVASLSPQQPAQQAAASLTVPKPMTGPPESAASKPVEPTLPPKTATAAPAHQVAAVASKTVQDTESKPIPPEPEVTVQHTEFGVDVGGANSISGLRALWRGLLKSKANAALTKLRPMIVIKENTNGLGMQLRLVAGPISDAAAAAKICASLTVSERNCTTAVFEGQRLALSTDESEKTEGTKADASKPETTKPVETGKADADSKSSPAPSRSLGHRHYYAAKRPKVVEQPPPPPPPQEQPSTLSLIFGRRS